MKRESVCVVCVWSKRSKEKEEVHHISNKVGWEDLAGKNHIPHPLDSRNPGLLRIRIQRTHTHSLSHKSRDFSERSPSATHSPQFLPSSSSSSSSKRSTKSYIHTHTHTHTHIHLYYVARSILFFIISFRKKFEEDVVRSYSFGKEKGQYGRRVD